MNQRQEISGNESGVVLVAVICFTAVAAILAIGLMNESASQLRSAGKTVNFEKAFYVAEGGAERAVAYLRKGGAAPTNLTGAIGGGSYETYVMATPDTVGDGNTHAVAGTININPNNSPQNEFLLVTVDGQTYDRESLQDQSLQDFTGAATLIRVKPKGNSDQTITVDGANYTLDRNTAYNFTGDAIPVVLTNDNRNTNGLAMGQWQLLIDGSGISLGSNPEESGGATVYYSIYSFGTVEGTRRAVYMDGVHQASWSRYAMWYNSGPGAIWFKSGEVFNGPVHANTFIYLDGNPVFNALVSSTRSAWGPGSDDSSVTFNQGFLLSAPSQSMASVSFNALKSGASLVITGNTSITLSGTNMLVSNARMGWTNSTVPIPSNAVIYAVDASSGSKKPGTINVGGTLDGRLTIVAETDIQITNHLTYAAHPTNSSDDALGLIARRDVVVMLGAPDDLDIFAHIMAVGSATSGSEDGSFKVEDHENRDPSGLLNVYGGIVQFYRGAVGTFNSWTMQTASGFAKNYTFDSRFESTPPPEYPRLTNEYTWTSWREK
ncbi:MAG: DUF4900 domain-containing protein [Kiritimatiellia bacterium]